jgi:hypothetical protein
MGCRRVALRIRPREEDSCINIEEIPVIESDGNGCGDVAHCAGTVVPLLQSSIWQRYPSLDTITEWP